MAEVGVQVGRLCPGCGREDSVPLMWGLPDSALMELADRGLVEVGGCLVPEEEPVLSCRSCGLNWGREGDPAADEEALAGLLGVSYADVVGALGTGWRRETATAHGGVQWFVSGKPAQVAVGVEGPLFVLARPGDRWGESRLDLQPAGLRWFSRDDLLCLPHVVAEAAEGIAGRRRRSFRWCRSCRRVYAPEAFLGGAGMCRACASLTGYDA